MPALTDEQLQTLTAICDRLVPADGSGAGAVEAGAPAYIGLALASDYSSLMALYERGLQTIDQLARQRHGDSFANLPDTVADSVLRELEARPTETVERVFFETVRNHTIEGIFGDPSWGGNRD